MAATCLLHAWASFLAVGRRCRASCARPPVRATGLRRRCGIGLALLATALAACAGGDPAPLQFAGAHAPTTDASRQLMVMVPADGAAAVATDLTQRPDVELAAQWPLTEIDWQCLVLSVPSTGARDDLLERLRTDRRLALVQPMQVFDLAQRPGSDPLLPLQTGFRQIAAGAAHAVSTGRGVRVAVIDSGVAATHPDLVDQVVVWRDMTGDPTVPSAGLADRVTVAAAPRHGIAGLAQDERALRVGAPHGTAVAGVIAAEAGNGIGIAGVAPDADVIALQACWEQDDEPGGRCSSFTLGRALNVALAAESDIINLSVHGPADPVLTRLLDEAERRSVIVVGVETGSASAAFPASHPAVVAVSAVGDAPAADDAVVLAPGRDIFTTAPANGYTEQSGGSMAAAHVTGVVALLRQLDPTLGPATARALLIDADGRGDSERIVNACASVNRLVRRRGGAPLDCPDGDA